MKTKNKLLIAIKELENWRKAFESTVHEKYEVNVFDCLNKRYIESGIIINKCKSIK